LHSRLLIVESVAGDFATLAEEDKTIGRVLHLDDVEPFMDLPPERLLAEITAQKMVFTAFPNSASAL
jgi:hypothetical protein